jgi:ABC-2 type transport system permease protein
MKLYQRSTSKAIRDAHVGEFCRIGRAFQRVGDQRAEALADSYRDGKRRRDRLAGLLAKVAPPDLLERILQRLAETDTAASIAYELEVRQFHAALRDFYYPKLFNDEAFDPDALTGLPRFSPAR